VQNTGEWGAPNDDGAALNPPKLNHHADLFSQDAFGLARFHLHKSFRLVVVYDMNKSECRLGRLSQQAGLPQSSVRSS
jgi:hypothetical protein